MEQREQEIAKIHRQYRYFYQVSFGIALVLFGVWIGSLVFKEGYLTNVYTDFLSVLVTIAVLDRLATRRSEKQRQLSLVRQARSQSNELAKFAIDELRAEGWLTDDGSLLVGANLMGANLEGADLGGANLAGANLKNAKLEAANLLGANLTGAFLSRVNFIGVKLDGGILRNAHLDYADFGSVDLTDVDLREVDGGNASFDGSDITWCQIQGAKLTLAEFQGASLHSVRFDGADLSGAKFQGASFSGVGFQNADLSYSYLEKVEVDLWGGVDLRGANLTEARLSGSNVYVGKFDERTILPDGSFWHEGADLNRFFDVDAPDFWKPQWDLA